MLRDSKNIKLSPTKRNGFIIFRLKRYIISIIEILFFLSFSFTEKQKSILYPCEDSSLWEKYFMMKTCNITGDIKREIKWIMFKKFPKISKSSYDFRIQFVLKRTIFFTLCENIQFGCLFLKLLYPKNGFLKQKLAKNKLIENLKIRCSCRSWKITTELRAKLSSFTITRTYHS